MEHKVILITGVASLCTAIATLVYVFYSIRMLRELRKQTNHLQLSTEFDAVQRVIDSLEVNRAERHTVYGLSSDYSKWTEVQKTAVEKVIRPFDIYGFLDRNGFVSRALLHQFYAYPVMTIWNKVSSYVMAERDRRGQPGHLWELEQLASRATLCRRHPTEAGQR